MHEEAEEHESVFESPSVDWDALMKAPPPPLRYIEGHDAYRAGRPSHDNPYAKDTDEYEWWDCGWCDAEGLDSWWAHEANWDSFR